MRGAETISVDMSRQATGIKTIKDAVLTVIKLEDLGVKPKDTEPSFQPSETALHEAGHALIGVVRNVGIDGADIVPSGNALGRTYPDKFDAPTAAGGYATGTGGEGHDQFVTEEIYGQNFSKAAATATVILRNNQEALMRLGRALDINKSLSRQDIYSIYSNSDKEYEAQNRVKETMYEVIVKGKNGEEREIVVLPENQTMVNVSLPQSGDIFVAAERELSKVL